MKNLKTLKTSIVLCFTAVTSGAVVLVSTVNRCDLLVDATDAVTSSVKFENKGDNRTRKSGFIFITSAQLSGGDTIYSYTSDNADTSTGIANMRAGNGELIFTSDSAGQNVFSFQKITAVKVTFAYSNASFNVMTSNNNVNYTDHDVSTGFDVTKTVSDLQARYVKIRVNDSSFTEIISVELFYTCSYNYDEDITIDEVSLNKESTTIGVGNKETLVATVTGTGDFDDTVTWSSNNSGIASVDQNGVVTGIAAGTTTITATSNQDGTKTATCSVTVTEESITISGTFNLIKNEAVVAHFILNDNGTGKYIVNGYGEMNISYSINGSAITFAYVSGDNNDNMGQYRLFDGSSTSNSTGTLSSEDEFTVKTYGTSSIYNDKTRTFTKAS